MTLDEKKEALQILISILQDNAGNRLTLSLVNGIVTTLDGLLPTQVTPPAPVAQPGPPPPDLEASESPTFPPLA